MTFLVKTADMLSQADILINTNSAAIFCTIMIIAIYESIYFMHQLRHSVEETEKLKKRKPQSRTECIKNAGKSAFSFQQPEYTQFPLFPKIRSWQLILYSNYRKLYRHILEVKDEQSILLQEELDVLKAYAFLLQTRFGNNLDVIINVPAERLKKRIVPLSLQILMENAIKHNIVSSDKPLRIEVTALNGKLVVSNNLQRKNQVNESTGIGLDNIRNRYKLLGNDQVEVTENGSNFTVSIPLIEN